MKKTVCTLFISVFIAFAFQSDACVGRILNIGIVKSLNENLLAELVSTLINERTGTTVNIKVFDNPDFIYEAVKKEKIGIVIENTDRAMKMLDIRKSEDKKKDYDISKKEFREKMNLIWLKPFGFLPGEKDEEDVYYSAVITEDVLINFPALPRVINKLKDVSEDKRFNKLLKAARSGKKVKRIARDYLKKKKLI